MFSKKLKKVMSLLIASSLTLSSATFARTTEEKIELNELIQQLRDISQDALPKDAVITQEENKLNGFEVIDTNLNLNTPEMVNIIVEFKEEPLAIAKLNKSSKVNAQSLQKEHNDFKEFLQNKNKEYYKLYKENSQNIEEKNEIQLFTTGMEYYEAFNGIAMSIRGTEIASLLESPDVKRIWKDSIITIDNPVVDDEFVVNTAGNSTMETQRSNSEVEPFMNDTVPYLGIDKIHAEGITGKGVKVGVLDTGIDYNHPDLKDIYVGGYDFIDMDEDPMEATYIEWQKKNGENPNMYPEHIGDSSYYTSHGTHVSGTIAGQAKNSAIQNVKGVAPGVELSVYRVLGPYGSGSSAQIIAGIEQSIKDGMDVINLSLGSMVNDPMFPTSIAINNASRAGVIPVVAAGNAGQDSKGNTVMYSVGAPGAAPLAITVGAATGDQTLDSISIALGENKLEGRILAREFTASVSDLKGESYDVVYCGKGTVEELKNKDLTGKVALIERGDFALYDKAMNASKKGAKIVIIYNNVPGTIDNYLGEIQGVPLTLTLSDVHGKAIKEAVESGNATITFGETGKFQLKGGQLAGFSSRGPVLGTFDIKPDVVATGVNIYSTYPEFINDKNPDEERYDIAYARISGTSMATPHIAGIVALLLEKYPEYTTEEIKALLMNTANDLNGNYSVYEEGAGMVDPYEAIHTDDLLKIKSTVTNSEYGVVTNIDHYTGSASFSSIYIGDSVDLSKEITLDNTGDKKDVYKVTYEFNYSAEGSKLLGVKDGVANNITFNLPDKIEVEAGSNKTFKFAPIVPETAQQGLYEGYIHFTNESNTKQTIKVPFSFRYTQRGIGFALGSHAFANKARVTGMPKAVGGAFLVNQPVKYVEFLLLDENDNPVGYLKRHEGSYLVPGIAYRDNILNIGVYKLTGDIDKPVSNELYIPEDGQYKIAMVSVDKDGETHILKEDMLIANMKPTVELSNLPKGINNLTDEDFTVELYEGKEYNAYWIKGRINDPVIDILRKNGHEEINQSYNSIGLYVNGRPMDNIRVNEDGTFKIGIEKSDLEKFKGAMEIGILGVSYSMMGGYNRTESILIYGEPLYGLTVYEDKGIVKEADVVRGTNKVVNGKGVKKITTSIMYDDKVQELSNIRISPELEAIASSNNGQINFEILAEEAGYVEVEVSVSKKDNPEEFVLLNGDIPVFDFDQLTRLNEVSYFTVTYRIEGENGKSQFKEGFRINVPVLEKDNNSYEWPIMVKAQGAMFKNTMIYEDNPNKVVESKIIYKDGEEVQAEYDESTELFRFKGLTRVEEVKMVSTAPGHITDVQTLKPFHVDEEGNTLFEPYEEFAELKAGDVNGDQVIDILDLKQVINKIGAKGYDHVEDLTGDGIVNDVDLSYVVENYLLKGVMATREPQKELDGKNIRDYITEAQMMGVFAGVEHETFTFKQGEELVFELQLRDISWDSKYDPYGIFEIPVMAAHYDENNRMIAVDYGTITTTFAKARDEVIVTPKAGAKKIKVFLWSGLDSMKVMEEYREFNIEE